MTRQPLRRWLGMAAVAAGLAAATGAAATDLKVSGVWTAFVLKNAKGQNVCGVSTAYPDGREFDLDWFEGDAVLTIKVLKPTWEIPPHVRPKVSIKFPDVEAWVAKGLDLDQPTNTIQLSVPHNVVQPFARDIGHAASATVSFPGGSEPTWRMDMSGFTVTLQAMMRCVDDIAGAASQSTPFAYMHAPRPGLPEPGSGSRTSSEVGRGQMD